MKSDFLWSSLIMMTSSNGNIFRVTGPLCGEFTGPGEFPTQRPVTRSFDVYFDLRLNKRLCKQSWGLWFETLLCPLWRHSNVLYQVHKIAFSKHITTQLQKHFIEGSRVFCWNDAITMTYVYKICDQMKLYLKCYHNIRFSVSLPVNIQE